MYISLNDFKQKRKIKTQKTELRGKFKWKDPNHMTKLTAETHHKN